MKLFRRLINAFTNTVSCNCALGTSEDPMSGKQFKHYKNEKLYKYLFAATPEAKRSDLVVVYQDIESKLIYTRPWNDFFASVGAEANRVPRFEEQE